MLWVEAYFYFFDSVSFYNCVGTDGLGRIEVLRTKSKIPNDTERWTSFSTMRLIFSIDKWPDNMGQDNLMTWFSLGHCYEKIRLFFQKHNKTCGWYGMSPPPIFGLLWKVLSGISSTKGAERMLIAVQCLTIETDVLVLLEDIVWMKYYAIVMTSSLLFCIFTETRSPGFLAESMHHIHRKISQLQLQKHFVFSFVMFSTTYSV